MLVVADILVFVTIYFVTMVAVVGGFDAWMLRALPRLDGAVRRRPACAGFVPRLAKHRAGAGRRALADDRAHHRRLHQHRHRQAVLARAPRGGYAHGDGEFLGTVHRQMRMVSGFEIVNHVLSMALVASTTGLALWLWTHGQVGVGAVARRPRWRCA